MLIVLGILGAIAGGFLVWWFFIRKKADSSTGGYPPRGALQELAGFSGNVQVSSDCDTSNPLLVGSGLLCQLSPSEIGICREGQSPADPGLNVCVKRTEEVGGGAASSSQACRDQCDAQEKKLKNSCYSADYNAGGKICLLRPLDENKKTSFCDQNRQNDPEHVGWSHWSPQGTEQDCPSASALGKYDKSGAGIPGAGTQITVTDATQCAMEVAYRNSKDKDGNTYLATFYPDSVGFNCEIFKTTDTLADCKTQPSDYRSSLIVDLSLQPRSCPNVQVVEKEGDLTANIRLRPNQASSSDLGKITSASTCSEWCSSMRGLGDPRSTDFNPVKNIFRQPASQYFSEPQECWCYDWPKDQEIERVFCSDQSDGNPRLTSPYPYPGQQPPVLVDKDMTSISPSSAIKESKCKDKSFTKPTCDWDVVSQTLSKTCDTAGFTEVLSILQSDIHGKNLGTQCSCIEEDMPDPYFPSWGLPLWTHRSKPDNFQITGGSCAGQLSPMCAPDSQLFQEDRYCMNRPGGDGSACQKDEDCPSRSFCNCGWFWDPSGGSWVQRQCRWNDQHGCGICTPAPAPDIKTLERVSNVQKNLKDVAGPSDSRSH